MGHFTSFSGRLEEYAALGSRSPNQGFVAGVVVVGCRAEGYGATGSQRLDYPPFVRVSNQVCLSYLVAGQDPLTRATGAV